MFVPSDFWHKPLRGAELPWELLRALHTSASTARSFLRLFANSDTSLKDSKAETSWSWLHGAAPVLGSTQRCCRVCPRSPRAPRVFAGSRGKHWVPGGIASRGSMSEVLPAALSRAVESHRRLFWYKISKQARK